MATDRETALERHDDSEIVVSRQSANENSGVTMPEMAMGNALRLVDAARDADCQRRLTEFLHESGEHGLPRIITLPNGQEVYFLPGQELRPGSGRAIVASPQALRRLPSRVAANDNETDGAEDEGGLVTKMITTGVVLVGAGLAAACSQGVDDDDNLLDKTPDMRPTVAKDGPYAQTQAALTAVNEFNTDNVAILREALKNCGTYLSPRLSKWGEEYAVTWVDGEGLTHFKKGATPEALRDAEVRDFPLPSNLTTMPTGWRVGGFDLYENGEGTFEGWYIILDDRDNRTGMAKADIDLTSGNPIINGDAIVVEDPTEYGLPLTPPSKVSFEYGQWNGTGPEVVIGKFGYNGGAFWHVNMETHESLEVTGQFTDNDIELCGLPSVAPASTGRVLAAAPRYTGTDFADIPICNLTVGNDLLDLGTAHIDGDSIAAQINGDPAKVTVQDVEMEGDIMTMVVTVGVVWDISLNEGTGGYRQAEDGEAWQELRERIVILNLEPEPQVEVCGNGNVVGEACDPGNPAQSIPANLAGQTCITRGFDGGTLTCTEDCQFDETACETTPDPFCGDGSKNRPEEECDGADLNGQTCTELGFVGGGDVACNDDCTLDTSQCINHLCNNGILEEGEVCDGVHFVDNATCASETGGERPMGTIICVDCEIIDSSQCQPEPPTCGNGDVDNGELCDGENLNGQTCITLGHDGGTLTCVSCAFDLSGCTDEPDPACGDGIINVSANGQEACDPGNEALGIPADLADEDCVSQGFDRGALTCTAQCEFEYAECENDPDPKCGDGIINLPTEDCDGPALGGETCETVSVEFNGGDLSCDEDCHFDTFECTVEEPCGNGQIDDGEDCDGQNLNGSSCEAQGFDLGQLKCTESCTYDTADCENEEPPIEDPIEVALDEAFSNASCEILKERNSDGHLETIIINSTEGPCRVQMDGDSGTAALTLINGETEVGDGPVEAVCTVDEANNALHCNVPDLIRARLAKHGSFTLGTLFLNGEAVLSSAGSDFEMMKNIFDQFEVISYNEEADGPLFIQLRHKDGSAPINLTIDASRFGEKFIVDFAAGTLTPEKPTPVDPDPDPDPDPDDDDNGGGGGCTSVKGPASGPAALLLLALGLGGAALLRRRTYSIENLQREFPRAEATELDELAGVIEDNRDKFTAPAKGETYFKPLEKRQPTDILPVAAWMLLKDAARFLGKQAPRRFLEITRNAISKALTRSSIGEEILAETAEIQEA